MHCRRLSRLLSLFLLLCLSLPHASRAEIQSFGFESLGLRVGVQLPSVPLNISSSKSSTTDETKALDYQQNAAPKIGLGFDWGFLGLYLSFLNLAPAEDRAKFGKTEYFDLQFHFFAENWGVDLVWQNFKGYYLANTKALLPAYYAANGNLIREDLESFFAGVNLTYVLNPDRLSYSAAMSGTALQKSNGGSWSFLMGYSDQELSSKTTLAPENLAEDYGVMGNIKNAHFKTFGLGGGYGYSWGFFTTWYFHISGSLALGPQYQVYSTQDQGSARRWSGSAKGLLRMALGSGNKRYFGGLSFITDTTGFRVEDKVLEFTSNFSFLYFGIRLGI